MKVVAMEGFISTCRLPIYVACSQEGLKVMAAWRRAIELALGDEDTAAEVEIDSAVAN
jgi:hypothetical protein